MAARYWVGSSANWDATAGTKWATTSGGAGGAAVPTSSDDVFFDAASGAVTVTVTTGVSCLSLTFTGYTGTFAMGTQQVAVFGSVILVNTATITGTGSVGLLMNTTSSTLTTNGLAVGFVMSFATSITITLADNLTLTGGRLRVGVTTINGNSIIVSTNGVFVVAVTGTCLGTTTISITGNGASVGADTVGISTGISNAITINSAGTITLRADQLGAFGIGTGGLTYLAGTVVFTATFIRLVVGGIVAFSLGSLVLPALTAAVGSVIINPVQDINITNALNLTTGSQISAGNVYAGGLTMSGIMTASAGVLTFNGTGTWSGSSAFKNNIIINTSGTLTISGTTGFDTGTFLYTAGTVTTTGNTMNIALTSTINASGMNFNNVTFSNPTITLSSDLNLNGTLTFNNTTVTVNGFNINTKSLTMTAASAGTTNIVLNGTGTWSGSGSVGNNLTINHAGTTTVSGSVTFGGAVNKTLTYTAGTVTTTSSTLNSGFACTLNTAGIIWNNISLTVQGTVTNNSLLTISGTLTYATNGVGVTFAGTAGWTCGIFTCTVAGMSHTFTVGNTYTITAAFNITAASNASRISLKSGTPGTKIKFTLLSSATQNVGYTNPTDLDSNDGQTISSFNGVITTTFNWSTLTYPLQNNFVFEH